MRKFRYYKGRAVAGVAAQAAGEELDRIAEGNDGRLLPADVVRASRPADAALHPAFEWDDPAAAELYRLDQARRIVRSVQVVQAEEPPEPAYVHVRVVGVDRQAAGHYETLPDLSADDHKVTLLLADMNRRVSSAQAAVAEVVRALEHRTDGDRLSILSMIAEALSTARALAGRLN